MMLDNLYIYVFVVLLWKTSSVSSLKLFPYGLNVGDAKLPKQDDSSSRAIQLEPGLLLSGKPYSSLYINSNGVISFNKRLRTYHSIDISQQQDKTIIAPYWADVDTHIGGEVWYRVSRESKDLIRANEDIRRSFQHFLGFNSTWTLIVTWERVAYYGRSSKYNDLANTFQAIISTDGQSSFVTFLYDHLDWTTGTLNNGDKKGLGGHAAQSGIIAESVVYKLPFSRTKDVVSLAETSNVGYSGKWVFRLHDGVDKLENDICRTKGSITLQPNIFIFNTSGNITYPDACLWPEHGFECVYNDTQRFPGEFKDGRAFCRVPSFATTGIVTVNISRSDKNISFSGVVKAVTKRQYEIIKSPTTPPTRSTVSHSKGSAGSGSGGRGTGSSTNGDGKGNEGNTGSGNKNNNNGNTNNNYGDNNNNTNENGNGNNKGHNWKGSGNGNPNNNNGNGNGNNNNGNKNNNGKGNKNNGNGNNDNGNGNNNNGNGNNNNEETANNNKGNVNNNNKGNGNNDNKGKGDSNNGNGNNNNKGNGNSNNGNGNNNNKGNGNSNNGNGNNNNKGNGNSNNGNGNNNNKGSGNNNNGNGNNTNKGSGNNNNGNGNNNKENGNNNNGNANNDKGSGNNKNGNENNNKGSGNNNNGNGNNKKESGNNNNGNGNNNKGSENENNGNGNNNKGSGNTNNGNSKGNEFGGGKGDKNNGNTENGNSNNDNDKNKEGNKNSKNENRNSNTKRNNQNGGENTNSKNGVDIGNPKEIHGKKYPTTIKPITRYSPCPGVHIENGELVATRVKDSYRVKCVPGYHLHGQDRIQCYRDGVYMGTLPVCIKIADDSRFRRMALIAWIVVPSVIVLFVFFIIVLILIYRTHKSRQLRLKQEKKKLTKDSETCV